MLTFAEEILLLALDDDTGHLRPLPPNGLELSIAGAILFELACLGRIDNDASLLWVVAPGPTGDDCLDEVCSSLLAQDGAVSIPDALALAAARAPEWVERTFDSLIQKRILKRKYLRFLWSDVQPTYPKAERKGVLELRRRIRDVVLSDDIPAPRDLAIISLARACRLDRFLFSEAELVSAGERLQTLAGMEFIGRDIIAAIRRCEDVSPPDRAAQILGIRHQAPKESAGGVPAVLSALGHVQRQLGIRRGSTLLNRVNQRNGFDCPGCAWPDPDDSRSRFEFCENGAKAVASEATLKLVGREFFERWSVEELLLQSDYWLEQQGRLVEPMLLRAGDTHYQPISYGEAFALIAAELGGLASPDEAVFYTGGRASNEAAFLLQLLARQFGTNNLPSSSNLCHEPSGFALSQALGSGKGTVSLEDFEEADAIFILGHNPGSNHPRMLSSLQKAVRKGCRIVAVNPLPEASLMGFSSPQEVAGFLGRSTPLASLFLPVRIGGDLALLKGMEKAVMEREEASPGTVLDWDFITQFAAGFEPFRAEVVRTDWRDVVAQSGLSESLIREAADLYVDAPRVIACWCLGITQHRESVATIQEIVNLMLLRGNVGRAGTGLCPVRGHSNVQGNRTMGIGCQMSESFLASLEKAFGFTAPRRPGLSAIPALRAMLEGRVRFLFSLGGNLAAAAPDTEVTTRALRGCRMTVMVSTKLNRSHLICGEQAVILPCLGRTEIDRQGGVPQFITVENTAGVVHSSRGCVEPSAPGLMSEPRLVAELAQAVLGSGSSFPWPACAQDYGLIRRFIEQLIPGYTGWGKTLERDAGFRLPNPASSRDFAAVGGKAKFMVHALSAPAPLEDGRFLLMTIRSHDQFNTTIHGLNDRYRGIRNERRVIFLNPEDMKELGIEPEQAVDITSHFRNVRRTVRGFYAIPYTIPKRCAAAYFPEANPLVPLDSVNPETMTPTSKSIVVSLQPSLPGAGRQRRTGGSRRA